MGHSDAASPASAAAARDAKKKRVRAGRIRLPVGVGVIHVIRFGSGGFLVGFDLIAPRADLI
jgi:hypothetical protein